MDKFNFSITGGAAIDFFLASTLARRQMQKKVHDGTRQIWNTPSAGRSFGELTRKTHDFYAKQHHHKKELPVALRGQFWQIQSPSNSRIDISNDIFIIDRLFNRLLKSRQP
jgi:hypothetical protein